MKTLCAVLLCSVISLSAFSQVSTTYQTQMDATFQVNRSYVTTGLLQDFGFHYTNVDKFNGIRTDSSYIEFNEWLLLYNSLFPTLCQKCPLSIKIAF